MLKSCLLVIEKLAGTQRREKLRVWLKHDLRDWFGPRILPIGSDVADHWGRLLAQETCGGTPCDAVAQLPQNLFFTR